MAAIDKFGLAMAVLITAGCIVAFVRACRKDTGRPYRRK